MMTRKALVGAIEQLAPPERQAAEMREEFRRVTEIVKKAGLTK